jgi:hypothetical protein
MILLLPCILNNKILCNVKENKYKRVFRFNYNNDCIDKSKGINYLIEIKLNNNYYDKMYIDKYIPYKIYYNKHGKYVFININGNKIGFKNKIELNHTKKLFDKNIFYEDLHNFNYNYKNYLNNLKEIIKKNNLIENLSNDKNYSDLIKKLLN